MAKKKITNKSLLGQKGINLIEQCVLDMGFAWHPSNQAVEAGIDGYIELRNPDSEQALNLFVGAQSKARTDLVGETADSFTFYCDQRDIDYWLQGNLPVILVVSRPDTRDAFWVNVKQHFSDPAARQTRKVVFLKARDRFDATARSKLFGIARPRDSGLYLAPLPKTERLLPNLLTVVFQAPDICFADTPLRDPQQVIDAFRRVCVHPGPDWVLHGGQVVSFQPLDRPPWPGVVDADSVSRRQTISLTESADPDQRRLLVRLLNRCLEAFCRGHDIRFDNRQDLFYFAATENLKKKSVPFKSVARESSRTIFEAYRDTETKLVRFCRHLAFEGHFRRLGSDWYLEVTPTYRFTRDGRLPDRFAEERLKGIKRLERHRAVLGQLLTWFEILTKTGDLFQPAYPHLAFERPEGLSLEAGIDDDAWFSNEDPDEAARLDREEAPTGLLFNQ
jgi:hypothetical protein